MLMKAVGDSDTLAEMIKEGYTVTMLQMKMNGDFLDEVNHVRCCCRRFNQFSKD